MLQMRYSLVVLSPKYFSSSLVSLFSLADIINIHISCIQIQVKSLEIILTFVAFIETWGSVLEFTDDGVLQRKVVVWNI